MEKCPKVRWLSYRTADRREIGDLAKANVSEEAAPAYIITLVISVQQVLSSSSSLLRWVAFRFLQSINNSCFNWPYYVLRQLDCREQVSWLGDQVAAREEVFWYTPISVNKT